MPGISKSPAQLCDNRGIVWLCWMAAVPLIGCSRPAFSFWENHGCPYLRGKRLKYRTFPEQADSRLHYYRKKAILHIAKGFQAAGDPPEALTVGGKQCLST